MNTESQAFPSPICVNDGCSVNEQEMGSFDSYGFSDFQCLESGMMEIRTIFAKKILPFPPHDS